MNKLLCFFIFCASVWFIAGRFLFDGLNTETQLWLASQMSTTDFVAGMIAGGSMVALMHRGRTMWQLRRR